MDMPAVICAQVSECGVAMREWAAAVAMSTMVLVVLRRP